MKSRLNVCDIAVGEVTDSAVGAGVATGAVVAGVGPVASVASVASGFSSATVVGSPVSFGDVSSDWAAHVLSSSVAANRQSDLDLIASSSFCLHD